MQNDSAPGQVAPEDYPPLLPFDMALYGGSPNGVVLSRIDASEADAYDELLFPPSAHHMVNLGLRGEYAVRKWGGQSHTGSFEPDTVCCIPAGVDGQWDTPRGSSDAIHIFVPDELIDLTAEEMGVDPAKAELRPNLGYSCKPTVLAVKTLFSDLVGEPACSSLLQQSLGRYLAYELLRCPDSSARPTRIKSARLTLRELRRVHTYMEERIGENIQVDDLAAVLRRSPYEFIRQFGRGAGLPPHRYLTHLRVERVAEALRRRELTPTPLSRLAMRFGFADQSHMTRWFKKVMGVTPAAYRREVHGTPNHVDKAAG